METRHIRDLNKIIFIKPNTLSNETSDKKKFNAINGLETKNINNAPV